MEEWEKKYLLLNIDKKCIIQPEELILSRGNTLAEISFVHPQFGNPFQYEFFHLVMGKWKGDRITLVEDTQEMRKYLIEQEGCSYYRNYKQKPERRNRREGILHIITIPPPEANRLIKIWKEFVNQYVLINYDSHLYMTIDQRLFRSKKNMMPFFFLARADLGKGPDSGSWSGERVGVEPIGTSTFDSLEYIEMFRMIGEKTACQLGVENMKLRYGHQQ